MRTVDKNFVMLAACSMEGKAACIAYGKRSLTGFVQRHVWVVAQRGLPASDQYTLTTYTRAVILTRNCTLHSCPRRQQ